MFSLIILFIFHNFWGKVFYCAGDYLLKETEFLKEDFLNKVFKAYSKNSRVLKPKFFEKDSESLNINLISCNSANVQDIQKVNTKLFKASLNFFLKDHTCNKILFQREIDFCLIPSKKEEFINFLEESESYLSISFLDFIYSFFSFSRKESDSSNEIAIIQKDFTSHNLIFCKNISKILFKMLVTESHSEKASNLISGDCFLLLKSTNPVKVSPDTFYLLFFSDKVIFHKSEKSNFFTHNGLTFNKLYVFKIKIVKDNAKIEKMWTIFDSDLL